MSLEDRRLVAAWAAACAERVLPLFEAEAPLDDRPRNAIERARAFSRGELAVKDEILGRFGDGGAARDVGPAAGAAARSAGQAQAVAHMGAHALGAAAYAVKAASLASQPISDEIRWQLAAMTPGVRAALLTLPMVGENKSGPLGPGLLSTGQLGDIIRAIQIAL
ncbi:MAG: hypothetical protein QM831_12870 [Kofleriaceae bacterium]